MSRTAMDEAIKDLLKYDPDTGNIYYTRSVKGRRRSLTEPAGTVGVGGYVQLTVYCKQYKAHRLAWFLYYGAWPEGQIDHINKDKTDNRIENLRVGSSVNQHNRDMGVPASGYPGAHKSNKKKPYKSSIRVDGVPQHLGYFETAEEAHKAYMSVKERVLASC